MHIIIVGNGKMSEALALECKKKKISYDYWRLGLKLKQHRSKTVCIHVGSGRQLLGALLFCKKHEITLIQGSSGQDTLIMNPPGLSVIKTPNFALPIISFLSFLPRVAKILSQEEKNQMQVKSFTESHQLSKDTVPGTAIAMAEILDFPISKIKSIRKYPTAHAYHSIELIGQGVKINLSAQIDGREAYAIGAINIARAAIAHRSELGDGVYGVAVECGEIRFINPM